MNIILYISDHSSELYSEIVSECFKRSYKFILSTTGCYLFRFWLNSRVDNTDSVIPPEAVSIKGPYILPRKVYKEKFLLSYK